MTKLLKRFVGAQEGATAIEYGLIAALIAVIAIVGMTAAGASIQNVFGFTSNKATTVWNSALS